MRDHWFVFALAFLIIGFGIAPCVLASSFTFSFFDVPGENTMTQPHDINNSGQVVGFWSTTDGNGKGAFLLSGGNFTLFNIAGASSTSAQSINDEGSVVGSYVVGDGLTVF